LLALMTYLNRRAIRALHEFRPFLESGDEERRLAEQMTSMPVRPVLLERKVLEAIPTWPWQSSTLHSILSALVRASHVSSADVNFYAATQEQASLL
jgi:hypothetical protein